MAGLLTASTLSTISALISITGTAISGLKYAGEVQSGKEKDLNSKQSILLIERVNSIGTVVHGLRPEILNRPIGHRIIHTLVSSMGWAMKYNNKYKIKKVLKFEKYRHIFRTYHRALSRDLADLSNMMSIHQFNMAMEEREEHPGFALDCREMGALIDSEPPRGKIILDEPGV